MPGFSVMFICYLYYIPYHGNTILRKFRQNIKPTLNHVYMLMSNFLLDLNLFSDYDVISQGLFYYS